MTESNCAFSLPHYQEVLTRALFHETSFVTLRDLSSLANPGPIILLRHDIDFSPLAALAMARLEFTLGIRTTYSVLLHSPLYNIGETSTRLALREISEQGHEIALHYDLGFFEEAGITAERGIEAEIQYLETTVGKEVTSIVQHRPARFGRFAELSSLYVDAYVHPARHGFLYVSDSGRAWRMGCVHTFIGSVARLQILIHPEWWSASGSESAEDIIAMLVRVRREEVGAAMGEYAGSRRRYLQERAALDEILRNSTTA